MRVTGTTSSTVSLAWDASTDDVSGVTGYQVFRGATQVGTPTGLTFTDTGLAASTTYSYTVRAVDGTAKVSAASTAVSATTTTVTQDFTVTPSPSAVSVTRGATRFDHGRDRAHQLHRRGDDDRQRTARGRHGGVQSVDRHHRQFGDGDVHGIEHCHARRGDGHLDGHLGRADAHAPRCRSR